MESSAVPVDYLAGTPAPATPPTAAERTGSPTADREPDAGEAAGGSTFHAVLSALNPLQYLPVVGTIYRAVTGDTIPEGVRLAGSMLFSGLTGGPLGLLLNAAATLGEKITGIDPETIAHDVADGLGILPSAPIAVASAPVREAGVAPGLPPSATAEPPTAEPSGVRAAESSVSEARRRLALASYARLAAA